VSKKVFSERERERETMAYQFPNESPVDPSDAAAQHERKRNENGSAPSSPSRVDDALQQRQQQQQQPPPFLRSSPIAIRRNEEEEDRAAGDDTSDSDGENGSTVDVAAELDAMKMGAAQSAPHLYTSGRLLRAPYLGALRFNDDDIQYHNMLPPALKLTEQMRDGARSGSSALRTGKTASYGSLRDSHLRGKFLDGPHSYRDGRTGHIHRLQQQQQLSLQFQEGAGGADVSEQSLSIGERLLQSRERQRDRTQDKEPTSSLAAMLEASDSATLAGTGQAPVSSSPHVHFTDDTLFAREHDWFGRDSDLPAEQSFMLSTSLTGLEVLQKMPQTQATAEVHSDTDAAEPPEELPRDAAGRNALLSRSHSDPTPRSFRRSMVAAHQQQQPASPAGPSRFLPPPRNAAAGNATYFLPPAQARTVPVAAAGCYTASFRREEPPVQAPSAVLSHPMMDDGHDPDTHAAFDFELE
jgi:hypothetical protein